GHFVPRYILRVSLPNVGLQPAKGDLQHELQFFHHRGRIMSKHHQSSSPIHRKFAAPLLHMPLHKLDRRTFMSRLGSGTAATAAALGLWSVPVRAEQTPKPGGHLIVGTDGASTTDSIDPTKFLGAFQPLVGFQIYDTLTDVDEHGNLVPQ